ncbi:MAG: glycosyltransferase family 2 protein [Candidatus Hydrothermia bacterium]
MKKPLVSVVVSLYNKGELVKRAIESVLCQTFQDFEVVVVDDCSVDSGPDTVARIADPRIRLLKTNRNSGPSVARDTGIMVSLGEFIAFLDADDEWRPGFLEACVRFMKRYPEAGFVATGYEIWQKGARHSVVMDAREGIVETPFMVWRKTFFVGTSAVFIKKEAYFGAGGFDERLRWGEDINLWIKVAMRYPMGYIPETLAIYHQEHPNRESARWFLGKPKPWIFSEEFMPVPEDFRKSPLYESFLELRAIDADRYMRAWLSLGRLCYARRFARQHCLGFWRPFFQELPNLARNLRVVFVAWLRNRLLGR